MTIRESTHFYYDGKYSVDMGLLNVNVTSGLQKEPFSSGREILEVKIRGRDKPYFQEIQRAPLSFNVSFAFEDVWSDDSIREISDWLLKDYYKELYFDSNLNKRYFAIVVDDPILVHNSLKQGYVNLTFRCSDAYAYSPEYVLNVIEVNNSLEYEFENIGHLNLKPEIEITKIGNGDISIINNTNGGKEFGFTNLLDGEVLYINCELGHIETDVPGEYRYDNLINNDFLELVYGKNILQMTGNFNIQFRYRYKFN